MLTLHTPVTVTAPAYTGPATIVGRAGPAHTGIVSSYRIVTQDGRRLRVGPGDVSPEEVRHD